MIGIIDYGMGNLLSVFNAVNILGETAKICSDPKDLFQADRLILPGVGAFRDCMTNLVTKGFVSALNESVVANGKPILGICLGMQAMARKSYENGIHHGLGWIEADVIRLQPTETNLRVPHIGWNAISYREGSELFRGLPENPDLFFVHSYYMKCDDENEVEATCDYGGIFTAAIKKRNIFATQFHPEKSQDYGLRILNNFLQWTPE